VSFCAALNPWSLPGKSKLRDLRNHGTYSVLTPYLIPPELAEKKVVNIGDGFILRAIERLVGVQSPERIFTSRIAPRVDEIGVLDQGGSVILAGANQLNDHYSAWPGLTAEQLSKSKLRLIPFGIGIHGAAGYNNGLSDQSRALLKVMHQRIEYSSWRCPLTVAYLERDLPDLRGRMLMTGCPVVYDRPLLEGQRFPEREGSIAVTITDRQDFWERETALLQWVASRFRQAKRHLVLHQNFLRERPHTSKPSLVERIREYARGLGYSIVVPDTAEQAFDLYHGVDMHFGSRLHAHLYFLSRNKRSFLISVDDRSVGIAESLGFPLCAPDGFDAVLDFDFEIVRRNAQRHFVAMQTFLCGLP
jgi:Polysaccharide pyruvyl transferase